MKKMMMVIAISILFTMGVANAQDVCQTQMYNIGYRMGSNGYSVVLEQYNDLNEGYKRTYRVYMNAGRYYQIASVCDEDCGDLDLKLYDGMGNLVSQDTAGDDTPLVDCSVYSSGYFTVEVIMVDCEIEPCKYGVAVFGK